MPPSTDANFRAARGLQETVGVPSSRRRDADRFARAIEALQIGERELDWKRRNTYAEGVMAQRPGFAQRTPVSRPIQSFVYAEGVAATIVVFGFAVTPSA